MEFLKIFPNIFFFPSNNLVLWRKKKIEKLYISTTNIIDVQVVKVLYLVDGWMDGWMDDVGNL
jgi:hypothetical protein